MNYLSHLFVADRVTHDPAEIAGNMMGDFVKGRLIDQYPAAVTRGLLMHRQVDRFTDNHPQVLLCKGLFPEGTRRYAGIALDVYFDYLLCQHWSRFSTEQRGAFIARHYDILASHIDIMPAKLASFLPRMMAEDWLGSYAELAKTEYAIERMSQHLRRPDGLLATIPVLRREAGAIEQAYLSFFPELLVFVEQQRPPEATAGLL